ncbi:hypothetical protein [Bacteroides fragilis]|nr:hypothetical protein [Bacteroides fragilis]
MKAVEPTLGLITALSKEQAAISRFIEQKETIQIDNDPTIYTKGFIQGERGRHCVVLACLTKYANNNASITTTNMVRSFPTIKDVIMLGIAAGVPRVDKKDLHVRLGDIVVSSGKGVMQFDLGTYKNGKYEIRDTSPSPSAMLLQSVNYLESEMILDKFNWEKYLLNTLNNNKINIPKKEPKKNFTHPHGSKKNNIHRGKIGASNSLLKDSAKRDEIARENGIIAFEMEGSGVAEATWNAGIGYLLVRGICDYADENKEDSWQEYAANVAAIYCTALLKMIPSNDCYQNCNSRSANKDTYSCNESCIEKNNVSSNRLTTCTKSKDIVYVAGFDGLLYAYNTENKNIDNFIICDSIIRCIYVMEKSRMILLGNDKGEIIFFDIDKEVILNKVASNSAVFVIHKLSDEKFIVGEKNGDLSEWEIFDGKKSRRLRLLHKYENIIFSVRYDGYTKSLIIVGSNGLYSLYKYNTGESEDYEIGNDTNFSVDINRSNETLEVVGLASGKISVKNKNRVFYLEGHEDAVRKVLLTKLSRWIISGSKDGTVRIWSALNNSVFVLYQSRDYIYDMVLSENQDKLYFVDALGDLIIIKFANNLDLLSDIEGFSTTRNG